MPGLPKDWYKSRTIWLSIFGAVAGLLALLTHHTITQDDINTLATDAAIIGGMIGAVGAIWGRVKASGPITGTKAAAAQAATPSTDPKGP